MTLGEVRWVRVCYCIIRLTCGISACVFSCMLIWFIHLVLNSFFSFDDFALLAGRPHTHTNQHERGFQPRVCEYGFTGGNMF